MPQRGPVPRKGLAGRKTPHVAVWIETSRGYGRGLIRGVADYVRQNGPWSIYFTPHGLEESVSGWLRHWRGDGILARINDRKTARLLVAKRLPMIDLRGRIRELGFPPFGLDNESAARTGFEYLRQRGFRHYGYYGVPPGDYVYMDQRREFFGSFVAAAGFQCHVHDTTALRGRTLDWKREQKQLGNWLLGLPKPIGILTCNDDYGQRLLDACRQAGVGVPEPVAVLGIDNDEELCNLSTPPLSSVSVNAEQIGFQAAALLDEMMAKRCRRLEKPHLFPASHVVTRLSTDTLAIDDPILAKALRFIRERAYESIDVRDVVRAASTSRRYLERQMAACLGRSPNQEILRVRLHRARTLLLDTDLSLATVAQKSGFSSAKYMGAAFVRETGERPGDLRKQHHGEDATE